jgi:hypothetical protein
MIRLEQFGGHWSALFGPVRDVPVEPPAMATHPDAVRKKGASKNLLNAKLAAAHCPIAASRARSRLAYLLDMSRCSLNAKLAQARGSLHSNMLVTVFRGTQKPNLGFSDSLNYLFGTGFT